MRVQVGSTASAVPGRTDSGKRVCDEWRIVTIGRWRQQGHCLFSRQPMILPGWRSSRPSGSSRADLAGRTDPVAAASVISNDIETAKT